MNDQERTAVRPKTAADQPSGIAELEEAIAAEIRQTQGEVRRPVPCLICHHDTTESIVLIPNHIFAPGKAVREFVIYPLCPACCDLPHLSTQIEQALAPAAPVKLEPRKHYGVGFIRVFRAFICEREA
ncbi:MAG: hypothetical protein HY078_12645 [Elusimicrobia bacterium]|nr:hypothetical protein [Elusimicrobiota bacterium]